MFLHLGLTRVFALTISVLLISTCSVDSHALGQQKPNVVLINLDDADAELFELVNSRRWFPNIMGLEQEGVRFNNFHVTTPLCGPSRACLYRGQYASNTGFYVNQPALRRAHHFDGGFKFYREQGYFNNDLSTWMKGAGYRTMLVGKFLHHDFEHYVPPGWDDYYVYRGSRYYGAATFTNQDFAQGASSQLPEDLYRTTAETVDAVGLISRHIAREDGKPFFLNVNPLGPHRAQPSHPEMVDRRMQNWWTRIRLPFSPAYDEEDISDKRGFFAGQYRLSEKLHLEANKHFRERVLATRSVDDMVGRIIETLEELGVADNTYIFVTSDNGFLLGHHRVFGKGVPVDRATRVPLFVKGPGVPVGQVSDHLVGHIDLAPTLVELAGGQTPSWIDGISFASLLTPDGLEQSEVFREALLIENWYDVGNRKVGAHAGANTLRLPNAVYTEWANGDKDYFDLTSDPHQLTNGYDELEFLDQLTLEAWLRSLKNSDKLPKARFTAPFANNEEIPHGSELFGLAEGPVGVARVKLQIYHHPTQRFWNGSGWQVEPALVDTRLDGPNHQLTFWRYPLTPEMSEDLEGTCLISAWAFDRRGEVDTPSRASFQFDNEPPTISLDTPSPGETVQGEVEFRGVAEDNVEIASVTLLIRDLTSNQYWNGQAFQSARIFLTLQPDSLDNWSYSASLPTGSYGVRALAEDTSGNISEGFLGHRFFVEE